MASYILKKLVQLTIAGTQVWGRNQLEMRVAGTETVGRKMRCVEDRHVYVPVPGSQEGMLDFKTAWEWATHTHLLCIPQWQKPASQP